MRKFEWEDAISFCIRLNFAGRQDWRIPLKEEFESLVDISQSRPALSEDHPFQNVQIDCYWLSNITAKISNNAWVINMGSGSSKFYSRTNKEFIWPVRGGTYDSLGSLIIQGCQKGQERFTDNQNGTVTDNRTGLIWIKDLNAIFKKPLHVPNLEPCPFCKGTADVYCDDAIHYICVCQFCGCEGPCALDAESAKYHWNTRIN